MRPEDRIRFIQAADTLLLVARDEAAKRHASERLLNLLVDLWQNNGPALYQYRGYTIFTTPGLANEWRPGGLSRQAH